MKQIIKTSATAIMLVFISFTSFSQEAEVASHPKTSPWVSAKGYWVVESNINTPTEQTITFYNNNDVVVYKEVISGVAMKLEKRKVKMQLKKALETSVVAWEENKIIEENKHYVAAILK
jgi:hypothetical protein